MADWHITVASTNRLKRAYDQAVKANRASFIVKQSITDQYNSVTVTEHEMVTSYAKYMLQYSIMQLKAAGKVKEDVDPEKWTATPGKQL